MDVLKAEYAKVGYNPSLFTWLRWLLAMAARASGTLLVFSGATNLLLGPVEDRKRRFLPFLSTSSPPLPQVALLLYRYWLEPYLTAKVGLGSLPSADSFLPAKPLPPLSEGAGPTGLGSMSQPRLQAPPVRLLQRLLSVSVFPTFPRPLIPSLVDMGLGFGLRFLAGWLEPDLARQELFQLFDRVATLTDPTQAPTPDILARATAVLLVLAGRLEASPEVRAAAAYDAAFYSFANTVLVSAVSPTTAPPLAAAALRACSAALQDPRVAEQMVLSFVFLGWVRLLFMGAPHAAPAEGHSGVRRLVSPLVLLGVLQLLLTWLTTLQHLQRPILPVAFYAFCFFNGHPRDRGLVEPTGPVPDLDRVLVQPFPRSPAPGLLPSSAPTSSSFSSEAPYQADGARTQLDPLSGRSGDPGLLVPSDLTGALLEKATQALASCRTATLKPNLAILPPLPRDYLDQLDQPTDSGASVTTQTADLSPALQMYIKAMRKRLTVPVRKRERGVPRLPSDRPPAFPPGRTSVNPLTPVRNRPVSSGKPRGSRSLPGSAPTSRTDSPTLSPRSPPLSLSSVARSEVGSDPSGSDSDSRSEHGGASVPGFRVSAQLSAAEPVVVRAHARGRAPFAWGGAPLLHPLTVDFVANSCMDQAGESLMAFAEVCPSSLPRWLRRRLWLRGLSSILYPRMFRGSFGSGQLATLVPDRESALQNDPSQVFLLRSLQDRWVSGIPQRPIPNHPHSVLRALISWRFPELSGGLLDHFKRLALGIQLPARLQQPQPPPWTALPVLLATHPSPHSSPSPSPTPSDRTQPPDPFHLASFLAFSRLIRQLFIEPEAVWASQCIPFVTAANNTAFFNHLRALALVPVSVPAPSSALSGRQTEDVASESASDSVDTSETRAETPRTREPAAAATPASQEQHCWALVAHGALAFFQTLYSLPPVREAYMNVTKAAPLDWTQLVDYLNPAIPLPHCLRSDAAMLVVSFAHLEQTRERNRNRPSPSALPLSLPSSAGPKRATLPATSVLASTPGLPPRSPRDLRTQGRVFSVPAYAYPWPSSLEPLLKAGLMGHCLGLFEELQSAGGLKTHRSALDRSPAAYFAQCGWGASLARLASPYHGIRREISAQEVLRIQLARIFHNTTLLKVSVLSLLEMPLDLPPGASSSASSVPVGPASPLQSGVVTQNPVPPSKDLIYFQYVNPEAPQDESRNVFWSLAQLPSDPNAQAPSTALASHSALSSSAAGPTPIPLPGPEPSGPTPFPSSSPRAAESSPATTTIPMSTSPPSRLPNPAGRDLVRSGHPGHASQPVHGAPSAGAGRAPLSPRGAVRSPSPFSSLGMQMFLRTPLASQLHSAVAFRALQRLAQTGLAPPLPHLSHMVTQAMVRQVDPNALLGRVEQWLGKQPQFPTDVAQALREACKGIDVMMLSAKRFSSEVTALMLLPELLRPHAHRTKALAPGEAAPLGSAHMPAPGPGVWNYLRLLHLMAREPDHFVLYNMLCVLGNVLLPDVTQHLRAYSDPPGPGQPPSFGNPRLAFLSAFLVPSLLPRLLELLRYDRSSYHYHVSYVVRSLAMSKLAISRLLQLGIPQLLFVRLARRGHPHLLLTTLALFQRYREDLTKWRLKLGSYTFFEFAFKYHLPELLSPLRFNPAYFPETAYHHLGLISLLVIWAAKQDGIPQVDLPFFFNTLEHVKEKLFPKFLSALQEAQAQAQPARPDPQRDSRDKRALKLLADIRRSGPTLSQLNLSPSGVSDLKRMEQAYFLVKFGSARRQPRSPEEAQAQHQQESQLFSGMNLAKRPNLRHFEDTLTQCVNQYDLGSKKLVVQRIRILRVYLVIRDDPKWKEFLSEKTQSKPSRPRPSAATRGSSRQMSPGSRFSGAQ